MAKRDAEDVCVVGLKTASAAGRHASVSSDHAAAPPSLNGRDSLLRRLVEENHDALIAFLRKRLAIRADAEDLAQDVYCKIAAIRSPDGIRDPRAYLFEAARNLLSDRARRERRRAARAHVPVDEAQGGDVACPAPSPERNAHSRLRLEAVMRALSDLDPKCRRAFLMVRFEGRSYKEVAMRLGVSVKAVEYQMRQALLHIQSRVDAEAPPRRRDAAE